MKARPVALLMLPDGTLRAQRPGGDRHVLRYWRGRWICECLGFWNRRRCSHAAAADLVMPLGRIE